MEYKFQYQNEHERNQLIETHSTLTLVREENLIDGNFLVFSDDPENDKPKAYVTISKEELETSKARITDLELTIAELMTYL